MTMIRIVNFFSFALTALACLALYHVSEQTRVAHSELVNVKHQIQAEHNTMSVLEAEWGRVADPNRIQHLAETRLGMSDTPTVELSSFELLPRRGDAVPLNNEEPRQASVTIPTAPSESDLHLAALHTQN
jgi:cell division protein FtsL